MNKLINTAAFTMALLYLTTARAETTFQKLEALAPTQVGCVFGADTPIPTAMQPEWAKPILKAIDSKDRNGDYRHLACTVRFTDGWYIGVDAKNSTPPTRAANRGAPNWVALTRDNSFGRVFIGREAQFTPDTYGAASFGVRANGGFMATGWNDLIVAAHKTTMGTSGSRMSAQATGLIIAPDVEGIVHHRILQAHVSNDWRFELTGTAGMQMGTYTHGDLAITASLNYGDEGHMFKPYFTDYNLPEANNCWDTFRVFTFVKGSAVAYDAATHVLGTEQLRGSLGGGFQTGIFFAQVEKKTSTVKGGMGTNMQFTFGLNMPLAGLETSAF